MKKDFLVRLEAVILVFFFVIAFCGPALAVSVQNPSVQNPSVQNPSVQNPSVQNPSVQNPSKNRCNPGYSLATYQGKQYCIKCNPGYSYTTYQGKQMCVK